MIQYKNGWTKSKVIKHIEKNFKGKAVNKDNICSYLTKNGKKCAVGLFIPDGHEGQKFKGGIYDLLVYHPDLQYHMPMDKHNLNSLQYIHDKGDNSYIDEDLRTDEEILSDIINYIETFSN